MESETTDLPLKRVTDFIQQHGKKYDSTNDCYSKEPFLSEIKAGKNSPVYNAHSYHTKVPPQGIEPFIEHYTNTGDLVLDPFCGSGMTGVAALSLGRTPLLIDISPAAAFIAYNNCTPLNAEEFEKQAKKIVSEIKEELRWLYETHCTKCGRASIIEQIVWSEAFNCPQCNTEFLLWDTALDKERHVTTNFSCHTCGKVLRKQMCKRTISKPVLVEYRCPKCGKMQNLPSEFDIERLHEINIRWKESAEKNSSKAEGFWPLNEKSERLWVPNTKLPKGCKTREPISHNITQVDQFYTPRTLWALGRIWEGICRCKDERTRAGLKWVFTSFNPSLISKLTRYNFGKRGNGPLTGTLYIPSFTVERNIESIWVSKAATIGQVFKSMPRGQALISTQSATSLANIPPDIIDYIFVDPPFGGNLMYSELNFIWESWLGVFTDSTEEAIVNKQQRKGIDEYRDLMSNSFKELYRVLKPGHWMTMVFHNSDGEVWQAIQDGLADAGFMIGTMDTFDKKQKSFNQITSSGAVGYDVVMNCYKPKIASRNGVTGNTTDAAIVGFLAGQLLQLPLEIGEDRTARKLHSKAIGFFMLQNKPLRNLSFEDFQKLLKTNFREIDGSWFLPYQRPAVKGQKKLFGYLSTEGEAIGWLERFLSEPRKYGDIAPEFFKALGSNKLQKSLQELLHSNFVEDKEIWRNPTRLEQETLFKKLTDKTARQIDMFLNGQTDQALSEEVLCEWIEFCYTNGLYKEGAALLRYIDESKVPTEIYQRTKKIAEICKIKAWEGS